MKNNNIIYGVLGTSVSTVGTALSVTELQAIISIIVTILGFLISVVLPLIIKLYSKIKEAKKDGEITQDEIDDIQATLQEGSEEIKDFIDKNKKKGEN